MTAQELYQTAQDCGLIEGKPNTTRARPHVLLRQVIMFSLRQRMSLHQAAKEVSDLYGRKYDHVTVIHAYKVIKTACEESNGYPIYHDDASKYIRWACRELGVVVGSGGKRRITRPVKVPVGVLKTESVNA